MAPRKTYHHGNLRQAVLDATLGLVESEGLEHLSMREIARRAGVSHGAPYHHFGDRASVLAAIAEDGYRKLTEQMRSDIQLAEPTPRARLEACGRGYVRFASKNPTYFRIMFRPELADPVKHPEVDKEGQRAFRVLVDCIAECQAAGLATHVEPMPLVMMAWSTAHGLAALWVDGPLSRRVQGAASVRNIDALSSEVSKALGSLLSRE